MRRLIPFFLLAMLGACTFSRPVQVPGIRVAEKESVAGCQYLDTVYGTSSWYGVFAERGVENARMSAFEKAQSLGGTHIVWELIPQGYGSSQVAGKVYTCEK